jgi:hypothetical protein
LPKRDLKSGQRGSSSPVQTPGGIIPFRGATSSRYGGRHHSVTVGAITSLWWAASPGISTTAFVAEQWGRRWITIDTSRVALALARARIMGARYPFYLLADSREGQIKEAETTRTAPSSQPVHGNIRHGFVYRRSTYITSSVIANNAEIDVIWDKWRAVLEPLREKLNAALKKQWQEWEIPREADKAWPEPAKKLHADWWQARIARQKDTDASIAAKAEFEYLYDKPYTDWRRRSATRPAATRPIKRGSCFFRARPCDATCIT